MTFRDAIGTKEERRFWAKVRRADNDDDCWLWAAAINPKGYGNMRIKSLTCQATHIALELAGKPRPSKEYEACHSCHNPPCVNPKHLRWGTHSENMQDRERRSREAWAAKARSPITSKQWAQCHKGHRFDYTDKDGGQICLTCHAERTRGYRARNKVAAQ